MVFPYSCFFGSYLFSMLIYLFFSSILHLYIIVSSVCSTPFLKIYGIAPTFVKHLEYQMCALLIITLIIVNY